jgi:hypothetical protein
MSTNRVTLAQVCDLPLTEIAKLPMEQIALLLEDVAELKASAKAADDQIYSAMKLRFADAAAEARKAKGVDTGTVRLSDGDYVVIADLPKKTSWDQAGLRQVEAQLQAMGEPIEDYISIKRDVSERAFTSWPTSLRKLFEPHRTLDVGKPTFKLERKKEAA